MQTRDAGDLELGGSGGGKRKFHLIDYTLFFFNFFNYNTSVIKTLICHMERRQIEYDCDNSILLVMR